MKHLTDGQLRAYLDGELDEEQKEHLAGCPVCQANLPAIRGASSARRTEIGLPVHPTRGWKVQGIGPLPCSRSFQITINR